MILIIQKTPRFNRTYRKLSEQQKRDFKKAVRLFLLDPFDRKIKTHKLRGQLKNFWSFSINFSDRVLFQFLGERAVMLYDIGDHDIYCG